MGWPCEKNSVKSGEVSFTITNSGKVKKNQFYNHKSISEI